MYIYTKIIIFFIFYDLYFTCAEKNNRKIRLTPGKPGFFIKKYYLRIHKNTEAPAVFNDVSGKSV